MNQIPRYRSAEWNRRACIALIVTALSILPISMSSKTFVRPDPSSSKTLLYVEGDSVYADRGGRRIFTIDKDGRLTMDLQLR